eukprot:Nitzschia sp. Nitz4//scaffold9_size221794//121069//122196//NITZ4_001357-RA/size221794-processed-gene-0.21-mRNA-1//1//CDS//3329561034//7977//frame0
MTIPSNNWCPTCEEAVHDHASICTVCGDTLGPPPSTRRATTASVHQVVPSHLSDQVRQASRQFRVALSNNPSVLVQQGEWETIPPHLLEPQGAASNALTRPTAARVLASLPRVTLQQQSSLLRQATLTIHGSNLHSTTSTSKASKDQSNVRDWKIKAIPGEFGHVESVAPMEAVLVLANPPTAKGGLSQETISTIRNYREKQRDVVVLLQRGDDVTFVQKAWLAQEAGASAVLIGNHVATPWPYVMKDSKGEAKKNVITIPVVMISREDAQKVSDLLPTPTSSSSTSPALHVTLQVTSMPPECTVCCETFQLSDCLVSLPTCSHVFHEQCVLPWLQQHHTCPYCRAKLPTDDLEYEREQRTEQSQAEDPWRTYYR